MARITVEDCLEHVDNRFELVIVGTKRARQLATGDGDSMVPEKNDKPTVIALREIEEGFVKSGILSKVEENSFEKIGDDTKTIENDFSSAVDSNHQTIIETNVEVTPIAINEEVDSEQE